MDDYDIEDAIQKAALAINNKYPKSTDIDALVDHVKSKLPSSLAIKFVEARGSTEKFEADIQCSISDSKKFVEEYCKKNSEVLKTARNRKITEEDPHYLSDQWFRCHFNTRHKNAQGLTNAELQKNDPLKRWKDTECPFRMNIKIAVEGEFPCSIKIEHEHNHALQSLQAISYKDIPDDVREEIRTLYSQGKAPSQVIRLFEEALLAECDNELDYLFKSADRSKYPRRGDFYNIYTEYFKTMFGGKNGTEMINALDNRLEELCDEIPSIKIRKQNFDEELDNPFVLAIVTPLMTRIHAMVRQASEMVFVDSSSNMEELNLRIFLLCTHSVVGALPMGILILSDEKEDTLIVGFNKLKECFGEEAFFSKGYPAVIMTDNCKELRQALRIVWPDSVLLLCSFHMLQQVWRWLHDSKHGVPLDDRPILLGLIKNILYAETVDEVDDLVDELRSSEEVNKYSSVCGYFQSIIDIREEWCIAHRKDLLLRKNHTNNYIEAQFLVIKDEILDRIKEYNVVGLVNKLAIKLTQHYKKKLLSVANGKFDGVYSARFKGQWKGRPTPKEIDRIVEGVKSCGNNLYTVPSFKNERRAYLVDPNIGLCECPDGSSGGPCKHQFVLWSRKISQNSANYLPVFDPKEKQRFTEIAIGVSAPIEAYEGLRDRMIG